MPKGLRSEVSIERDVVAKAFRELGVPSFKLSGPGHRGAPDRLFLLGSGEVIFVEFKRPGGKTTRLQDHIHHQLRDLGYHVEVCDSVDEAMNHIQYSTGKAAWRG